MIHSIGYNPCPSKKWLFTLCVCACHPKWYDCGKVALGTYMPVNGFTWVFVLWCRCLYQVFQLSCTVGRWTVSQLLNHHTQHDCGQTNQYNWYLICPGLGFKRFHWLDKYKHIWSCHIVWIHTHTHTQKLHECSVLDCVFGCVFCFSEQLDGCETVGEQHELRVHCKCEAGRSTAIITCKFKHSHLTQNIFALFNGALSYRLILFQMFLLKFLWRKSSCKAKSVHLAAILITAPGSYFLVVVQYRKIEISKKSCQDYVSIINNKIWLQCLFSFNQAKKLYLSANGF